MLAAGSLVLSGLGLGGAFAADPQQNSTVVGSSAWYTQAYENFNTGGYLTPQQADVTGPQRAPYGTSSHRITIGESSAQTELYRTDAYDGVAVGDLTRLEYSELARTTLAGGADRQAAYLRLSVDNDGTDGTDSIDASLFFFPANNGTVVNGQWQSWDVANGTLNIDGDGGATTTLADYANAHPNAVLVNAPFDQTHDAGALALIAGGALGGPTDPQTNGEYFVDRVVVGNAGQDTLYDFGGGSEVNGGTTDLTVDPAHDQGWKHQAYDNVDYLTSDQALVDGPGVPPLGEGSLRFTLLSTENPDRVELFRTTQYDDTFVRDLRTLTFSTFARGNAGNVTPQQPAYLRLSVDNDGDGTMDNTLYFYPANNGAVQQATWQTWSAAGGLWNVDSDTGVAGAITLSDYVVAHPDAKIVVNGDAGFPNQPQGGVAFLVGGGGASQMNGSYYLDDITIGKVDAATGHTATSKRFDLEPTAPTLTIGDASVAEGNSGATLTFPVTLSRPVVRAVTAHYATGNDSAKAGDDYRATSGTLTIPAGSTTGTVSVPVVSDRVHEASETMHVSLTTPVGATVADGTGVGTILDDDTAVGLGLRQARHHRVRVVVSTSPVAAGAPVTVYRVLRSGAKQLLATNLDANGRLSVRLAGHYRPGTRVTMVAKVQTANGPYRSLRVHLTVR
ncbi:hypothetical protein EFL26_16255 [Nocardioides pocheonensis]|uniref:Calx-beta domain-containing protein n=1 Tax=Nocardioides pocheonensis TaxID=661485 RepID=A0A3N0GKJ2_9ACTN|nr:hypothetical protein EFL26_16255 [Nocardioides pocheonensis]